MISTIANLRGVAFVSTREEFEDFVTDFHTLGEELFEELADWYKFFCDGEQDMDNEVFIPDILQLVEELDENLVPDEFPALIMFDFVDFNPKFMQKEEAIFLPVPITKLEINKMETSTDKYKIHFAE